MGASPGLDGRVALVTGAGRSIGATIAPYKYPRAVEFIDALPRTETGKVQRFELRERAV